MESAQFKEDVFSLKDLMYRVALRLLNDTDEAEDAVQQTMMKMWDKRNKLSGMENLRGFVLKSVQNDCLNRLKREQVISGHHLQLKQIQKSSTSFETGNMVDIILKEINKLPDKQRMIIQLCDVEGFDRKEAAAIVDIDEGAVRVNLSRARKKVQEQIQKIKEYEERQL